MDIDGARTTRLQRVRSVAGDALAKRAARRAAVEAVVLLPLLISIPYLNDHASLLSGAGAELRPEVRIGASLLMVVLGWAFARDVGRLARPLLFRKIAAEATGPVDFILRAATLAIVVAIALHVAGVPIPALGTTGTVGVVMLGLAAQQSLGNVFAGFVLLGVHPYHIGDRVRLQGPGTAGIMEGRVAAMGLFYTRLSNGADEIHVPNSAVLNTSVTPLREPEGVDLRATLAPGVTPSEVQVALRRITTPTRATPRVDLEEVDQEHVVVRITATPRRSIDGNKLADEVIEAIGQISG